MLASPDGSCQSASRDVDDAPGPSRRGSRRRRTCRRAPCARRAPASCRPFAAPVSAKYMHRRRCGLGLVTAARSRSSRSRRSARARACVVIGLADLDAPRVARAEVLEVDDREADVRDRGLELREQRAGERGLQVVDRARSSSRSCPSTNATSACLMFVLNLSTSLFGVGSSPYGTMKKKSRWSPVLRSWTTVSVPSASPSAICTCTVVLLPSTPAGSEPTDVNVAPANVPSDASFSVNVAPAVTSAPFFDDLVRDGAGRRRVRRGVDDDRHVLRIERRALARRRRRRSRRRLPSLPGVAASGRSRSIGPVRFEAGALPPPLPPQRRCERRERDQSQPTSLNGRYASWRPSFD